MTWNPTGPPSSRTMAPIDLSAELTGVSCASGSLCFVFDGDGRLFTSTDPTGSVSAWSVGYDDAGMAYVTGVSCPVKSECVAVDSAGNLLLGSPPPTATEIAALLHSLLTPSGHGAEIAALLGHAGYRFSFKAPNAGRLLISWYLVPKRTHLTRSKPQHVLVATIRTSFAKAETRQVEVKLTRNGKQLLRGAKHLRLTAEGTFTSTGGPAITAFKTFTLNR